VGKARRFRLSSGLDTCAQCESVRRRSTGRDPACDSRVVVVRDALHKPFSVLLTDPPRPIRRQAMCWQRADENPTPYRTVARVHHRRHRANVDGRLGHRGKRGHVRCCSGCAYVCASDFDCTDSGKCGIASGVKTVRSRQRETEVPPAGNGGPASGKRRSRQRETEVPPAGKSRPCAWSSSAMLTDAMSNIPVGCRAVTVSQT
jgi:hypothetical protein